MDEGKRREMLGLRFLNEQSESFVQKAIKSIQFPNDLESKPDANVP
jgi:hypothetical protein